MKPILIVDDEVEMRIAMSETLKHCGYPVETSHNAIDALNKVKKNEYSMVITDMTMPKRSGLELLKDIKNLEQHNPVLMVTATAPPSGMACKALSSSSGDVARRYSCSAL